jgi:hypothetical protein
MTLRLLPPSLDRIAGYVAALEAGWSPDTMRDVSGEQLALYQQDPAALIDELTREDGTVKTATGEEVPRLPSRTFWLDDGEFCGSINLRFQRGTDELPPQVSGTISATRWCRGSAGAGMRPFAPAHDHLLRRQRGFAPRHSGQWRHPCRDERICRPDPACL